MNKKNYNPIVLNGLYLIVGIVGITVLTFAIRVIGLEFNILWAIPALTCAIVAWRGFKKERFYINTEVIMKNKLLCFIIIVGISTQIIVLFRAGLHVEGGSLYPSIHDTMWNIALTNELRFNFPPMHPGLAGEPLKNNHYFYPLFLATTRALTGIDIINLYYRLSPVLVSLTYGLSLFAISTLFAKKYITRCLAVLLGYYSGNLAYLLPLFKGAAFSWAGNNFSADQPFDQIINPYSILGYSIYLFACFCLYQAYQSKAKVGLYWSMLVGLLGGGLYGFKSFGGVIFLISVVLSSILMFLIKRDGKIIKASVIAVLVFLPIFLYTTDFKQAVLSWAPGWLLTEMVVGKDKLDIQIYAQKEQYYRSIKNYLGLGKIKLVELSIYIVGNLGTRILGSIFLATYIVKKRRKLSSFFITLFLIISVCVALLIPLLFNLGGNAHNIIQFTPYGLVILSVFTALFLEWIYNAKKITYTSSIGLIGVFLLLLLSAPVNIKNIISKLEPPNGFISNEEAQALTFIKEKTDPNAILLINPNQFLNPIDRQAEDPIYIPALSQRRVYLSSPGFVTQVGKDPKERLDRIETFFNESQKNSFLRAENISYIYVLKPFPSFDDNPKLPKVYENQKVAVYKVNL